MRTRIALGSVLFANLLITPLLVAQAPAPSSAEQLQQLTAQLQQSPGDHALREKIIALALTVNPRPATPDAATMAEGAAEYAFKNAKATTDFSDAAKQYEKALLLAPWLAADYFNCGVAYEKAGDNKEAIRSFNLYLLAAPNADDAQAVKRRIGGLQYVVQKAQEQSDAAARQAQMQSDAAARQAQMQRDAAARQEAARIEVQNALRGLDGGVWQGTHDEGFNANGSHYHDSFYVNCTYIAINGLTVSKYFMTVTSSDNRRVTKIPYNPNKTPVWTATLTSHVFNGPTPINSYIISYVDEFTISDDGKSITEKFREDADDGVIGDTTNYVRIK